MGEWPVLQSYALHWGMVVRFGPKLDEVFEIGNDKQTVSPIEDFWRVLAKADVDDAVRQEEATQKKLRKKRTSSRPDGRRIPTSNPATDAATPRTLPSVMFNRSSAKGELVPPSSYRIRVAQPAIIGFPCARQLVRLAASR